MLDSIWKSQAVKRRGDIINSELMEGEQCHESHQTVDHLKTAYKTGLWNALYDFFSGGFKSYLLKLVVKLVCIPSAFEGCLVASGLPERREGERKVLEERSGLEACWLAGKFRLR